VRALAKRVAPLILLVLTGGLRKTAECVLVWRCVITLEDVKSNGKPRTGQRHRS